MSDKTTNKNLGGKIKMARKSLGLSQKDFGKLLKISDKAISSYEVGRTSPNFDLLQKMSQVTHRPVVYFGENGKNQDIDLELRMANIEKELLEVKKLLDEKRVR